MPMRLVRNLFLATLLLPLMSAGVALGADNVHQTVLDNGMKVIVKEDHRAPVVVSQVWYKVGSSYEHGGITGVSHILEHMMFKGTSKHPAGEFSRIIAEHGGRENAFTARDYTAYFQQLEASRLPVSFELEADRMRNLQLPADEFLKERDVVLEERRLRTEDDPDALTYEQFMAAAFNVSPYQNPIIGWADDLRNMAVDDLRRWYRQWYSPNNATLVVVGDVEPKEVFTLAERHFGKVENRPRPSLKPRLEPQQKGTRRVVVEVPAQLPLLILGYKTPVVNTAEEAWRPYALEVLASILDGGDSARLTRELVRGNQIAASANAGYDLYARQQSLLTLDGVPAKGHTIAELEQAFRQQVQRLREELISGQELARVKAQVTAAKVYEKDSVFYQAMQIGILETVGIGWPEGEKYVERINAVTPEQVRQVARDYLTDSRLTVAVLEPQPLGDKARPQLQGVSHGH